MANPVPEALINEGDALQRIKRRMLFEDIEDYNNLPLKATYHFLQALSFIELAAMSFKLAAEEMPDANEPSSR